MCINYWQKQGRIQGKYVKPIIWNTCTCSYFHILNIMHSLFCGCIIKCYHLYFRWIKMIVMFCFHNKCQACFSRNLFILSVLWLVCVLYILANLNMLVVLLFFTETKRPMLQIMKKNAVRCVRIHWKALKQK